MLRQDLAWLVIGGVSFAALFAARDVASDGLVRAAIAGVAFVVLGLTIGRLARARR